ncbi:MAG: hypothetical protein JO287_10290, partial [Pseudonocardiales bacterium]|nr:hypothetical protein [Pseudonocardiales bacterium]
MGGGRQPVRDGMAAGVSPFLVTPDNPAQTTGRAATQVDPTFRLVSQVLAIVALLALGFLTQLTLLGGLQHSRDQAQAFRELRVQLAIGTAPVGPLGLDGKALPSGTPVAILEIP